MIHGISFQILGIPLSRETKLKSLYNERAYSLSLRSPSNAVHTNKGNFAHNIQLSGYIIK